MACQEKGDEACFVGLVGGGVGGVADGGLEGVVAGFEADADDAIDAVFEVEVSPEPVFEDFAHVAGGMEVGGVGAEGEPVVGGTALGVYLLSMFPKLDAFLPARLLRGMELLQRAKSPEDYYAGITAAGLMVLLCMVLSVGCFDWKQL